MAAPREVVQVLYANPRQAGYLGIREDFLTRLDRNHDWPLFYF